MEQRCHLMAPLFHRALLVWHWPYRLVGKGGCVPEEDRSGDHLLMPAPAHSPELPAELAQEAMPV